MSKSGALIYFGGGMNIMLSSSVGLLGSVIYQIIWLKPEGRYSRKGNSIGLGFGFAIFV